MGIPANRNDYVYWEDQYKLGFDDLSAVQRQFLEKLNNRLTESAKRAFDVINYRSPVLPFCQRIISLNDFVPGEQNIFIQGCM